MTPSVWLAEYVAQPLGHTKAFPDTLASIAMKDVKGAGLNLAAGDLPSPVLVLRESALGNNITAMAEYCRRHRVSLAPHGKTTMSPQIFARQLQAGAWGITAATCHQAEVMRRYGVRRVLLANQVIDPVGLAWLTRALSEDPDFEVITLVDSPQTVQRLDAALEAVPTGRTVKVLLELGVEGGRAGVRGGHLAMSVVEAVAGSTKLVLSGVECFEGILGPGREPSVLAKVDRLLDQVMSLTETADRAGAFASAEEIIVSAGGSVFFDHVVQLGEAATSLSKPKRVVLRSGCYVSHDSGVFEELSPLGGGRSRHDPERLQPALELWSTVLSRPEPGLAILDFGRRDAPFDAGLPIPLRGVGSAGETIRLPRAAAVRAMHDQHAMLNFHHDGLLGVGDRVVLGISHPCTAFDKWPLLPVVDDELNVVSAIKTEF